MATKPMPRAGRLGARPAAAARQARRRRALRGARSASCTSSASTPTSTRRSRAPCRSRACSRRSSPGAGVEGRLPEGPRREDPPRADEPRAEEDPPGRVRDAGLPLRHPGRRDRLRRQPDVVEPHRGDPAGVLLQVPMQLTLSGKFHQVAKFFHGVGQLDRIINLEDIQIKEPKVARGPTWRSRWSASRQRSAPCAPGRPRRSGVKRRSRRRCPGDAWRGSLLLALEGDSPRRGPRARGGAREEEPMTSSTQARPAGAQASPRRSARPRPAPRPRPRTPAHRSCRRCRSGSSRRPTSPRATGAATRSGASSRSSRRRPGVG